MLFLQAGQAARHVKKWLRPLHMLVVETGACCKDQAAYSSQCLLPPSPERLCQQTLHVSHMILTCSSHGPCPLLGEGEPGPVGPTGSTSDFTQNWFPALCTGVLPTETSFLKASSLFFRGPTSYETRQPLLLLLGISRIV